jgi:hypothetical protein
MADSPLASAAAVDPVTNPMGALQAMQTQRVQKGQEYLDQQRGAYETQMSKLTELLNAPTSTPAAEWGAIAKGASSVAPTMQNFGQMLAASGGAYGAQQELARQQQVDQQQYLTKLQEGRLKGLESDQAKLVAGARGTQGFEFRKNSDGTTSAFSKATGLPIGTFGPQDISKISAMAQTLAKAAFERGEYDNLDDALQWAMTKSMESIGKMEGSVGNRTAPLAGNVGGLPTTPAAGTPPAAPATAPEVVEASDEKGAPAFSFDVSGMSPADKKTIMAVIQRYKANPNPGTQAAAQKEIERVFGAQTAAQTPVAPTAAMPKKDEAKKAMEKGTAEVTGKALGEEHGGLNQQAEASGTLIGQLNLLRDLYSNPNMPEGQQGETLQNIRSTLKTFGVEVGPEVGAADLASSIAGKMALLTRTADGKNLMPGAMSDFEQKILRGLVPSLQGTAEGRMALIDIMEQVARARMRFAEEANKMAEANRGILPSEWNSRKQRLMKEEMAKLAAKQQEIAARFKGAK